MTVYSLLAVIRLLSRFIYTLLSLNLKRYCSLPHTCPHILSHPPWLNLFPSVFPSIIFIVSLHFLLLHPQSFSFAQTLAPFIPSGLFFFFCLQTGITRKMKQCAYLQRMEGPTMVLRHLCAFLSLHCFGC